MERTLARSLLVTLLVSPVLAWTWSVSCAWIGSATVAWGQLSGPFVGDPWWIASVGDAKIVLERTRSFVVVWCEHSWDSDPEAPPEAWSRVVALWRQRDGAGVFPTLGSDPPEWSQYAVLVSGWPAPAVWAGRAFPSGEPRLDESIVVQPFRRVSSRQPWRSLGLYPDRPPTIFPSLPWRPLWPGFLINTGVMWGVLLGIAVCRVRILRARDRRRLARGLCPACRYDVANLPPDAEARITCPECGEVWKGSAKWPNDQMAK